MSERERETERERRDRERRDREGDAKAAARSSAKMLSRNFSRVCRSDCPSLSLII